MSFTRRGPQPDLSSFILGMPYISRPPARSSRSIDGDGMSPAVQLIRHCQSRGAGADDGHGLSGANRGICRGVIQPAAPGVFNDGQLVVVDRSQDRRLSRRCRPPHTGRGANPAGELRKVVGDAAAGNQGLLPVAVRKSGRSIRGSGCAEDSRSTACRRTSCAALTEGHAAVHASGGLLLLLAPGISRGLNSFQYARSAPPGLDHMAILTLIFHKSSGFSHL